MLKNILETCGLNKTEREVFIHLLSRGSSIASGIATKLRLKRPTVYAALDGLVRVGIVTKQKKEKVTYYFPVSLGMIPKILEQRAQNSFDEISGATKLLEKELKNFQHRSAADMLLFENVTFESIEAVYSQLENSLLGGDFCAFFNPQTSVTKELQPVIEKFLRESSRSKANIREIAVSGPRTDWYKDLINNKNHQLKEIPADSKFISDFILVDGQVIMLDYDPKNEIAIKIRHKNHYQSMQTLFELVWNSVQ